MIDFHTLRSDIKRHLLALWQRLDVAADPMSWAWIARAFASDGIVNNPSLAQTLDQAQRWLNDEMNWHHDANLGSIGLFYQLLGQARGAIWESQLASLDSRVARLCEQVPGKFAKLNNPDFAFGLAHFGQVSLSDAVRNRLCAHYVTCAQSENIRRAALFAAAVDVLGGSARPLAFDVAALNAHEIIPLVWLAERYPQLIDGDTRRRGVWEAYEQLKDGIALEEPENSSGALHVTSPTDLAMLYEAVVAKTKQTDFVAIFNNMPWHPAVYGAAGSLFLKGEYVAAVFEGAKKFIDAVKHRAGQPVDKNGNPLDGGPLMNYVFGAKPPRLKFTSMSTQTEQNEHRGLALIAEGIVSALRNPKGHLPSAAIMLTPEEALEQLATISYLMRRLDQATP